MEPRDSFKKVIHFANWEYKEKRPKSVKVLRLKAKSTITLGVLPEFQMKSIGPIIYLVVSDQGEDLMIYFFNRNGDRIGGHHYEPTAKFMKRLKKSTKVKFQLPKKERTKYIDATYILQQNFSKIHQHISKRLSITHKYPYTVLIDKNLQFTLTPNFGGKKIKKEIHIPLQIQEKSYLELFATIEWFYTYLTSSIPKVEEISSNSILYDLAILLSAVFNRKFINRISKLRLPPQDITIHNITFTLIKKVNAAISTLSRAKSQKTLTILLIKYCNLLKVLPRYRISLSLIELVHVFIFTCEMFNIDTDFHTFYCHEQEDISTYFYFRVFTKVHELAKQFNVRPLENKTYFISLLFGLNQLDNQKILESPYTLAEVIENIEIFIKDPYIYEPIGKIDNFVSDIISEYIYRYLECEIEYAIKDNTIDITLELWNNSNHVLRNVKCILLWRPNKKIQLVQEEKKNKAQDLHEKIKTNYIFSVNNKGTITLSCQISFTNPIYQNEIIKKSIPLQKIILE